MTFKEQISVTARAGIRMFGVVVLLLVLSRVTDFFNNVLMLGIAKGLFFLGLSLMFSAVIRSIEKRDQRKFEKNGWTHPLATVGPVYRWYYRADRNGKDRDA